MRYKEQIFTVTEKPDNLIIKFFRESASGKHISMHLEREPFFEALQLEGEANKILTIKDTENDVIAAALILNFRDVYINCEEKLLCYVSSLNVANQYRKSIVLARLLRLTVQQIKETPNATPFCFASVFADNTLVTKLFNSGKGRFGEIINICEFSTYILKKRKIKESKITNKNIFIRKALNSDIDDINNFIQQVKQKYSIFPVYKENHENTFLKYLNIGDIHLAFTNNKIVGILALWKQGTIRNWQVIKYSRKIHLLKPFINFLALLTRKPTLPPLHQKIDCSYFSMNFIENNDEAIFIKLFNSHINSLKSNENPYLAIGFPKNHFNLNNNRFNGINIKSIIYGVNFSTQKIIFDNNKQVYIELGSL